MPYRQRISPPAFEQIDKASEARHAGARELASYFAGQGIGLVHQVRPARQVVQDFISGFADAYVDLQAFVGSGGHA